MRLFILRRLLLTAIFLIVFTYSYSQDLVQDYFISSAGDTLLTKVKVKTGLMGNVVNDFFENVELVDTLQNSSKVVSPEQIREFSFIHKGRRYHFYSKPVKSGEKRFLQAVLLGEKSSLFQYGTRTSGGGYALPSKQVFYTFEKADGSYLCLRNILNKKFRSELKAFYQDNPAAQALIDTKLKYWLELESDLIEILSAVNRK
jgi:hypothetical protein